MKTMTFLLLATILQIMLMGDFSVAAVYKWEDAQGAVHFTDNPDAIPLKYRNKAKNLEPNETFSEPVANKESSLPQQAESVQPPETQNAGDSRGKEYWQMRFNTIRNDIKFIKDGLPGKRERMEEYRHKWVVKQKRADRQTLNQIEDDIRSDEEKIKDLEKQLDMLDVEASRSAVPMEWRQ